MAKKILVVGSSNMDLSMNLFKVPDAGQTVIDDGGVAYTPGGKGANSAVALSKLGAHTVFCSKLGADVHGQRLFSFYKDSGIDTSYIKVDHDYPTGFAVVMKEASGENRIVVYPGANNNLTNDNILDAFSSNPDALYLGFEIPFSTAVTAAKIAASRGVPIFIDAAPASADYPLQNLPPIEIFSPNETETMEYTGITPAGAESSLRAAYSIYSKVKCKYVVLKLGARGAFVFNGKHCDMIPAYKPDKLVDTTAAGDTFTAGMTLEYLRNGGNIIGAVNYGAAAAAIAVSRKGASSSVPSAEEVRKFMETHRN